MFAALSAPGRDLVQQWLEQVEIAAVDQRDFDGTGAQRLRAVKPAEPAADDDHPMPLFRRHTLTSMSWDVFALIVGNRGGRPNTPQSLPASVAILALTRFDRGHDAKRD